METKKNRKKLTPEREQFCRYIVDGKTQTDAYLLSFPTNSRETARVKGCKLARLEEIQNRISALRSELGYQMNWDKARSENLLTDIAEGCYARGDYKSAIKAITELNKMLGYHAPETTITANLNANAKIEIGEIHDIMRNLGYERK